MSRLESIPPDLSAVLSLLLRRGKRYSEVAGMLGIEEHAVHDRAHAALALLAPAQARGLSAAEREQLGEYLLGQQSATAANQTRDFLASSSAARAWAQALSAELAPLATARALPSIPAAREASSRSRADRASSSPRATREPDSPREPSGTHAPASSSSTTQSTSQPSSSRVGGAVVLGALAAIAIVVVLLIVGVGGGGGGSHTSSQPSAAATTQAHHAGAGGSSKAGTGTSATPATSATGASTSASSTSHGKALELRPPDGATSQAVGVAYVLTQKTEHAFYVFAKGLPALPSGAFYAVWLEGAASAPAYPLGSLPAAGSSGLVEGGGPLPSSAGSYSRIIVTSETSHHPSHPGPTLLDGAFSLH
jgi:hypothetical protein